LAASEPAQYLVGRSVSARQHQENHPCRRKPVFLLVFLSFGAFAMGKRPSVRTSGKKLTLYAPYDVADDWLRVKDVLFVDGERMCRSGVWVRIYDAKGSHVGYEMCQREEWNSYVTRESPRAISASEMMLYAGRAFRFGRSRTAGLTEKQRLARRDERTGLWLPPEDKVERVEAKVEYLGQHRLVA